MFDAGGRLGRLWQEPPYPPAQPPHPAERQTGGRDRGEARFRL